MQLIHMIRVRDLIPTNWVWAVSIDRNHEDCKKSSRNQIAGLHKVLEVSHIEDNLNEILCHKLDIVVAGISCQQLCL